MHRFAEIIAEARHMAAQLRDGVRRAAAYLAHLGWALDVAMAVLRPLFPCRVSYARLYYPGG